MKDIITAAKGPRNRSKKHIKRIMTEQLLDMYRIINGLFINITEQVKNMQKVKLNTRKLIKSNK